MMDDDDKITKLPVRYKDPNKPLEQTLVRVAPYSGCTHGDLGDSDKVQYIIDERLAEVTCSLCNAKLNPMWVLEVLARHDHHMWLKHRAYQEEMRRLKERQRTKCDHCGHMTRISHR